MATMRNEDYLEAIDAISKHNDKARVKDISAELGIGMPSVTEMLQKLHNSGYILYERYRGVRLTTKGKRIAEETRRKHVMLRKFLLSLGVSEKTADEDACRMEHILDKETIVRLTEFVGKRGIRQ